MADYEPCETIEEFLQAKGGVGLMALLHERPMTYSEIESEIEITSSTITNRRDDAAALGLLTIEVASDEHGTKKVYILTDMGEYLADKMAREGMFANYRKMRMLQQLVDEQTGEVIRWVRENPSQLLAFPEADKGIIDVSLEGGTDGNDGDPETGTDDRDKPGESEDEKDEQVGASDQTSEYPSPPSDSIPDGFGEVTGNETQETLTDIGSKNQTQGKSDDDDSDP